MDGPREVTSWQLAQVLAADHMVALGFTEVSLTPAGADAGLDVIAVDAAAQVKHYSTNAVGRPDLQRLRGATGQRPWVLFYSLAGYSAAAVAYGDSARIALFRYNLVGDITAENRAALELVERGVVPRERTERSASRVAFQADMRSFGQAIADAATVVLHVLNQHLAEDLEAVRAGRVPSFVTEGEVPTLMRQALALQAASQWVKAGDEYGRTLGDWADGLVDFEALVQTVAARLDFDFEDAVRAGRTLRSNGFLGRGIESDQLPVSEHLAAARSVPSTEGEVGPTPSSQDSYLTFDW